MNRFFSLTLLLAMLTLSACRDERFAWHQKITVTVETPAGMVWGVAVQSLSVTKALSGMAGQPAGSKTDLRGEAVAVEVLPGRWLFQLLEGWDVWLLPSLVRPGLGENALKGVRTIEVLRAAGAAPLGATFSVPTDTMPKMVSLDDISDPKTVQWLDSTDLAATFGPGVSLVSVTLEVTDDPITEGRIEAVLPWLEAVGRDRAGLKGKPTSGLVSDQPDPEIYMISPGDFSTELFR